MRDSIFKTYGVFIITFALMFYTFGASVIDNGGDNVGRNRHQTRRKKPRKFDNKVAVSPSRSLTCSPPPFIVTAAAARTLPSVNSVFTKPKFAFAFVRVHAEWRTTFADKVR